MTKYFLLVLTSALAIPAFSSNDFGKGDRPRGITPQQLRERLQIDGNVSISSPDGTRLLYESVEHRTWKFGEHSDKILSNWNFQNKDGSLKLALKHEWTVGEDGVIRVRIQQFESMTQDTKKVEDVHYGKKIREETIVIKDFAPVLWTVSTSDQQRAVAHFVLTLQSSREPKDSSDVPIVIENGILTDGKNRVWAENIMATSGKYTGLSTHLGTLAISFYPFPGAKAIGVAEGNELEVRANGLRLTLRSTKPFVVGYDRMKVYGIIDTSKRTLHPGSIGVNTSTDPKNLWED